MKIIKKSIILFLITLALSLTLAMSDTTKSGTEPENHTYKIYLTFDDGPSKNTVKVLDILKAHNIKATFFVIGDTEENPGDFYRRILSEGHTLGLHSFSHNTNKIYASVKDYITDFEKLRALIFKETGTLPRECRMVGGSRTSHCSSILRTGIINYFDEAGYRCYDWDIDPLDSGAYALHENVIFQNIVNAVEDKPNQDLVILLHDDKIRKTLPAALEMIIPYFIEKGYRFDALKYNVNLNNSRSVISAPNLLY